jgi:hypothetical protein
MSPWLERARWSQYLGGLALSEVAPLARLPDPVTEPILQELADSIDRLVDAAHTSIREDKINAFAQRRINKFLPNQAMYSRPLMVKLQKAIHRQYKCLWKRLLCFVTRCVTKPSIQLRHQLTTRQTALLDKAHAIVNGLAAGATSSSCRLDDACLDLCISLLDHRLKRSIFESVVLGFLAVLESTKAT